MKLTDAQRFELFRDAFRSIVARSSWPTKAPPNRRGEQKPVRASLGVAVWSVTLARDAAYVLEHDGERGPEAEERAAGELRTDGGATAPDQPW